jgi:hypothetical protein
VSQIVFSADFSFGLADIVQLDDLMLKFFGMGSAVSFVTHAIHSPLWY